MYKVMSGQVPPSLATKISLNQSRYSGKFSIPTPRIYLFKSSLVYCGTVLRNSLPDSRRLPSNTEKFKSPYMSCIIR